jgi:hypothetical protein
MRSGEAHCCVVPQCTKSTWRDFAVSMVPALSPIGGGPLSHGMRYIRNASYASYVENIIVSKGVHRYRTSVFDVET